MTINTMYGDSAPSATEICATTEDKFLSCLLGEDYNHKTCTTTTTTEQTQQTDTTAYGQFADDELPF